MPPNWKPNGYLERLPKDPWGNPYQYLNPGLRGEIDVFSYGADGQPGGHGVRRRHRLMGPLASSTARTGPAPWRSRAAGFTLAEILVVLIVIGLAAGLTYARFDNDPRQTVEREGRRLAAAIEHAAALAQWRNQTLGVSSGGDELSASGDASTRADGDRWVPLTDDDVLVAASLPDGARLPRPLNMPARTLPPDAILPLAASGRNEPYAMEIASPEWRTLPRRRSAESRRAVRAIVTLARRCQGLHAGRGAGRAGDPRRRPCRWFSKRRAKRRRSATALKARTLALWVAQNRLALAQLEIPAPPPAIGRAARWKRARHSPGTRSIGGTPNPAFRKIEITVADESAPDYVLARLVGYLGQR